MLAHTNAKPQRKAQSGQIERSVMITLASQQGKKTQTQIKTRIGKVGSVERGRSQAITGTFGSKKGDCSVQLGFKILTGRALVKTINEAHVLPLLL